MTFLDARLVLQRCGFGFRFGLCFTLQPPTPTHAVWTHLVAGARHKAMCLVVVCRCAVNTLLRHLVAIALAGRSLFAGIAAGRRGILLLLRLRARAGAPDAVRTKGARALR